MFKIIGADSKEYGPVSTEQIRQWIAEGRANAQTQVKAEGTMEWKPLGSFPEFAASVASGVVPPPAVPVQLRPHVPNYLVPAILSTICCCLPFGIVAIVFAAQVNAKLQAGDMQGAMQASQRAKIWFWVAVLCGLISTLFCLPLLRLHAIRFHRSW
jgi:hypothetical protein